MSRKIKQTKVMKIKDPNSSVDSRYALKRHRAKKGIFSPNSPFNPINHGKTKPVVLRDAPIRNVFDGTMSAINVIDRMIEKNRGVSNEQLSQPKLEVDEPREEGLQS